MRFALDKSKLPFAGRWFTWVTLVIFGLVVGLLVVVALVLRGHQGVSADRELKKYQQRIGRHVVLPAGETPALVTISDPAKVGSNSFLKQGQKGDKILIYAKWKRAVMYRPSQDRIVDISPVNVDPPGGDSTGFTPLN